MMESKAYMDAVKWMEIYNYRIMAWRNILDNSFWLAGSVAYMMFVRLIMDAHYNYQIYKKRMEDIAQGRWEQVGYSLYVNAYKVVKRTVIWHYIPYLPVM